MGVFRFDLLAIFGYSVDIAVLKTILSFHFVFGFVCKRVLSKLQKSNLENRIVYSFQSGSICHDIYPARGRKRRRKTEERRLKREEKMKNKKAVMTMRNKQ